jgi:hypothetical protein
MVAFQKGVTGSRWSIQFMNALPLLAVLLADLAITRLLPD